MSIVSFWCAFDARLQFSKPKRLWQYYPRCPYRKTLSASPSFRIIHAEVSLVSRLLVSPRLQPEKKTSLLTRGKQRTRSTDVVLSICLAPEKTGFCFVLGKSALMFRNKTSVPRGCTLLSHPQVKNVACPRICPTSKWAWHVHYYYFFLVGTCISCLQWALIVQEAWTQESGLIWSNLHLWLPHKKECSKVKASLI